MMKPEPKPADKMNTDASADNQAFLLTDWPDCSLFLDFDGTLVDLAETPDTVVVVPGLVEALATLRDKLGGRLAIVSGRPIEQIDAMLAPLKLPAARWPCTTAWRPN